MKHLSVLLVALLLPLALPAAAQEPVSTHIADDQVGDVKVAAQGQGSPPPSDMFAAADLKSLDVVETPDEFIFTLGVATLKPQSDAPFEGAVLYTVHFLQHDKVYRLRLTRQYFLTDFYSARLEGFDAGRGGYYNAGPLEVQADPATHTLTVTVPRNLLLDANGAAPHPEVPVTGFRAASQGAYTSRNNKVISGAASAVTVTDAMPDSGNATVDLEVHFGVRQSGHARLSSLIPTRASNGEATTFVFLVEAANLAPREDTFALSTSPLPNGWGMKLPSNQVTIPGNGSVLLPVLVTTPFTHTHGSFQNFVLSLTSVNDPGSVGRIQLGVRYMQPPQPAGHHAQIWFHSDAIEEDPATDAFFQTLGFGSALYMNAADVDPTDKSVAVPAENEGTFVNGTAPTQSYTWEVPLSPGLEMGLDFDTAKEGLLQVNIRSQALLPGAVLSGHLAHYGAPEPAEAGTFQAPRGALTVLADVARTAPQDINGEVQVSTPLLIRPEADFVPFQKGASLMLVLNLTTARPDQPFFGTAAPAITPGSSMILPLFEYHDPVNDIFLSDVELVVRSAQDRFANPGKVALFNLTLQNHGAEGSFDLELTGTNSNWARFLPNTAPVVVPAGGSYNFSVVVAVPDTVQVPTNPGAEKPAADLVVSATNRNDANQRALVRLYTTVDNGNHRDDASLVAALDERYGAQTATPGFGLALLVLAIATAGLATRRRHG